MISMKSGAEKEKYSVTNTSKMCCSGIWFSGICIQKSQGSIPCDLFAKQVLGALRNYPAIVSVSVGSSLLSSFSSELPDRFATELTSDII